MIPTRLMKGPFSLGLMASFLSLPVLSSGCSPYRSEVQDHLNLASQNETEHADDSVPTDSLPNPPPPSQPPPPPPPPSPSASSGGRGGIAGVFAGKSYDLQLSKSDVHSRFYFFVPSDYQEQKPRGLVIAFHGVEGTDQPNNFFTLIVKVANKNRFIVVSPAGNVTDGGSGAWCQPFAREIMTTIRQAYNINNAQQFVTGLSGGLYPAIWFALSTQAQYINYCGEKVASGFQKEFAAVGFTAPAYSPASSEFSQMSSLNISQLGFSPAMWMDYGQLTTYDRQMAQNLAEWGKSRGYHPIQVVERPNQGHPPAPPFNEIQQMFNFFADSAK